MIMKKIIKKIMILQINLKILRTFKIKLKIKLLAYYYNHKEKEQSLHQ